MVDAREALATLKVDFNARITDDLVRLTTRAAIASLTSASAPLGEGALVWLSDGEVRVRGEIVAFDGELVARIQWASREDLACRRCSECRSEDHHLLDGSDPGFFSCKHCPATISRFIVEQIEEGRVPYDGSMWRTPDKKERTGP